MPKKTVEEIENLIIEILRENPDFPKEAHSIKNKLKERSYLITYENLTELLGYMAGEGLIEGVEMINPIFSFYRLKQKEQKKVNYEKQLMLF